MCKLLGTGGGSQPTASTINNSMTDEDSNVRKGAFSPRVAYYEGQMTITRKQSHLSLFKIKDVCF